MLLQKLSLQNYRNYSRQTFDFDPKLTIVVGPNAQGKTNLLEAIHLICSGKGIKEHKQDELILTGKNNLDVRATFVDTSSEVEFRIHIAAAERIQKAYFVQKARKMLYTYAQQTPPVVIFTPEMIRIIDGSPSERRTFFDSVLSTIDIEYRKRLRIYETNLRKRNRLFHQEENRTKLRDMLLFWSNSLIEHGSFLQNKREWLVAQYNDEPSIDTHEFALAYEPNEISRARFTEYFMKEYYQKRTLIGPQRDEFTILLSKDKEIDTKIYASRGEQRLALLWIILRQIALYQIHSQNKPILLLDDIFSELDEENKKRIFEVVQEYQTIITTTDRELVSHPEITAKIINL